MASAFMAAWIVVGDLNGVALALSPFLGLHELPGELGPLHPQLQT